MSRAQICAVLGFGLMLAAASTEARELGLSVDSRIAGDSNVFRSASNRIEDGFLSLSPRVSLREPNSTLNYDFSYAPTYEAYFETSGINGFDHRGKGNVSWRPTAVDTLDFDANFVSLRSLRTDDLGGSGTSLRDAGRERRQNSDAQLSYNHAVTEVLSVQASATFEDTEYSKDRSIDSRSYSGQLGTQYVLNSITMAGLFVLFRQIESRDGRFQFKTDTEIWNVGMTIQRALTPTLTVSLQAGPSFISTKQDAPTFPVTIPPTPTIPDSSSRSISYFAAVNLQKTWLRSGLDASYTRSESSGSGDTSTSIVDNVVLHFKHRLSRRWSLRAMGAWLQSREIEEVPGGRKQKTTQYRAFASITRRMTRRLSMTGHFSYFNQDQNETARSGSVGDVFSGVLSLRYTFDPIRF